MADLRFGSLRVANVERCVQVFHAIEEWSPTDWATAMGGECGEALNVVKKIRRLDGADKTLDSEETRAALTLALAHELADVVIYADLLAARMGIDLGVAVVDKFNVVSRKRDSSVFLALEQDLGQFMADVLDFCDEGVCEPSVRHDQLVRFLADRGYTEDDVEHLSAAVRAEVDRG